MCGGTIYCAVDARRSVDDGAMWLERGRLKLVRAVPYRRLRPHERIGNICLEFHNKSR